MLVVCDTSPLSALMDIERAELLRDLFKDVVIPVAVRDELLARHDELPDWLDVRDDPPFPPTLLVNAKLGRGETAAISLALELHADIVLIDERRGRREAERLGLTVTGVLGMALLAKRRGLVSKIAPLIDDLRQRARCWFDNDLVAEVLRTAGEAIHEDTE